MAQHRTKEDKQSAEQHRLENSKLYSLSSIDTVPSVHPRRDSVISVPQKMGIDLHHVREDLLRTAFSIVVVLILLGVGTYYLS